MKIFQTKDGTKTGFVPGVGQIVDGKISVPDGVVFENANFVEVVEAPQAPAPAPAPVAPVAPPASTPATDPAPALAAPANEQPVNKETE